MRSRADPFGIPAVAASLARLFCGLLTIAFLFAAAPCAFADELPGEARKILTDSGAELSDVSGWDFAKLCDTLGNFAADGFRPAVQFAAKAAGYLLLAGLLGLLAGSARGACVEVVTVLGLGSMSLSAAASLTRLVGTTAQDCRTYLTSFVPVFSGIAAAGGQTSGALVYSGMFFAMSGFIAAVIQKILLPVMQVYFCFAVCAGLWGGPGIADAVALFSRCMQWLLKVCGGLFSLVLGLQITLASTADSAALRTGKGILQGAVPVVGDAAAAALTGASAALQLVKGSLTLAGLLALGALLVPVVLQSAAYALAFAAVGMLAGAVGQKQCAQLCRLFFEGARLCGAVLILYFFIIFLSTALLLLAGNGG